MTTLKDKFPRLSRGPVLGAGAALLLALGAAGGAGAVSLMRPPIEMAPLNATPIGKLSSGSGVVTVKGKVIDVFGDRIVVQDQTGKTMIDVGRASNLGLAAGQDVTAQGRYDDGQFRASYLVGANGRVNAIGPAGAPPHGPREPGGPGRPPHESSPISRSDRAAPPLPAPAGCDDRPSAQAAPPPPPVAVSPEATNVSTAR
ncbi:hypothetical protein RZN05_13115 [Sphingomonas sp. HF-S4]|uniref:DUF5666 domain-containing protein n=1 Tax=Sphingomonas agrestis TaxID=3080540 RepID=A0ABU3Y960_9SPHN|nr:hypothetical protein [Sphingomonas sp. HF-S4]MDV3457929.1 hypothetical protein [Sphingomonas sp. HF-S4]